MPGFDPLLARAERRSRNRRAMFKPERCAWNLFDYSQALVSRVGMTKGRITATLSHGYVVGIDIDAGASFSKGPDPPPDPAVGPIELFPGGQERPARYSLDDLFTLFKDRLARLLRSFDVEFGEVIVEVRRGRVETVQPVPHVRPKQREIDLLGRLFSP